MSVSRAQLDNNIHIVLEAFETFKGFKIVLVSNWSISKYGIDLKEKYSNHPNMILLDAIYDKDELDYIRGNGYVYIHSHSRCGTAPSLVEAMCLKNAIISFDVPTNRETTQGKANYFSNVQTLTDSLKILSVNQIDVNKENMLKIASKEYIWKKISKQYKKLFQ